MINVALIGAGAHSLGNHAPALQRYAATQPGRVRLAAVCDLNLERARAAAAQYGFAHAVRSIPDLFGPEVGRTDALIAVLPISAMAAVTPSLFERHLPILIEKPLGANLAEAEAIAAAAARTGMTARVMVSFNRRYDPAVARTRAWLANQSPPRYVRGTTTRTQRTEPDFVWGTGAHLIDLVEYLVGPLVVQPGGVVCPGRSPPDASRIARLTSGPGTEVLLEILPTAGSGEESIRIVGDEYQLDLHTGAAPPWRVRALQRFTVVLEEQAPADEAPFVGNGSFAETAGFLDAVVENRPLPGPSLSQALASSRLAAQIDGLAPAR